MADTPELTERIKSLLIERLELGLDPAELAPTAALMEEVGLDSAALLELVAGLEEEFGLEIDVDEITEEHFRDLASLARFIAARR